MEGYEDTHAAAKRLGVHVTTVTYHLRKGNLEGMKLGRDWWVKKTAVPKDRGFGRPSRWNN